MIESTMDRKLIYLTGKCSNECLYCFSNWDLNNKMFDELHDYNNPVIIYPSCNNEIYDTKDFIEYIEKCIEIQSHYCILSFSTKTIIKSSTLQKIKQINDYYLSKRRGFIKISVSITNKSMISEIEPNAAEYNDRLKLLKLLRELNIPTSVIIKPILPFIDVSEYKVIVQECSIYTRYFVTGDLYINTGDPFYIKYIKDKYKLNQRRVSWLKDEPLWHVVECENIRNYIQEYIRNKNLFVFESDRDFLQYYKLKEIANDL